MYVAQNRVGPAPDPQARALPAQEHPFFIIQVQFITKHAAFEFGRPDTQFDQHLSFRQI